MKKKLLESIVNSTLQLVTTIVTMTLVTHIVKFFTKRIEDRSNVINSKFSELNEHKHDNRETATREFNEGFKKWLKEGN